MRPPQTFLSPLFKGLLVRREEDPVIFKRTPAPPACSLGPYPLPALRSSAVESHPPWCPGPALPEALPAASPAGAPPSPERAGREAGKRRQNSGLKPMGDLRVRGAFPQGLQSPCWSKHSSQDPCWVSLCSATRPCGLQQIPTPFAPAAARLQQLSQDSDLCPCCCSTQLPLCPFQPFPALSSQCLIGGPPCSSWGVRTPLLCSPSQLGSCFGTAPSS